MDESKVLSAQELREGLEAAEGWKRFMLWHGVKISGFMAACGALIPLFAYIKNGQFSPWSLLIPAVAASIVLPHPIREFAHFTRMVREFRAAQARALMGDVVRMSDIPTLARRPAA